MKKHLASAILVVFFIAHTAHAQEEAAAPEQSVTAQGVSPVTAVSPMDIVIVLDNSGSMKKNDPEFLTREVVSNFLDGLSEDSRVSFVVFAEESELVMPLTYVTEEGIKERVTGTMARVNYSGQYTDTPAGVESAIYELKVNGREGAKKSIILMTDGKIDTGDPAKDIERQKWLENQLAEESKEAEIRIFGIAFTEKADFQLIQTLGQKTGGEYYRAPKAEDIQGVFSSIKDIMLKPPAIKPAQEPQPQQRPEQEEDGKDGSPIGLLIVAIVGLVVLGIVAIVIIFAKRGKRGEFPVSDEDVPEAFLVDLSDATGQKTYKLQKRTTVIGRQKMDGIDMAIGRDTVSAVHAQIEYKDHNFYLKDLNSKNGTYLDGGAKRITSEVLLKSGSVISFERHKFRFKVPGQAEVGGTQFASLSGKTVLSAPDTPEQPSPEPEETQRESGLPPEPKDDKGQEPVQEAPPAPQQAAEEDDEETKLKPTMCPNHPAYSATQVCPICKEARCDLCMVEKDGRKICRECAAKGQGWLKEE